MHLARAAKERDCYIYAWMKNGKNSAERMPQFVSKNYVRKKSYAAGKWSVCFKVEAF